MSFIIRTRNKTEFKHPRKFEGASKHFNELYTVRRWRSVRYGFIGGHDDVEYLITLTPLPKKDEILRRSKDGYRTYILFGREIKTVVLPGIERFYE